MESGRLDAALKFNMVSLFALVVSWKLRQYSTSEALLSSGVAAGVACSKGGAFRKLIA